MFDTFPYNNLAENPTRFSKRIRAVKRSIKLGGILFSKTMRNITASEKDFRKNLKKVANIDKRIRKQSLKIARIMKSSQNDFF